MLEYFEFILVVHLFHVSLELSYPVNPLEDFGPLLIGHLALSPSTLFNLKFHLLLSLPHYLTDPLIPDANIFYVFLSLPVYLSSVAGQLIG